MIKSISKIPHDTGEMGGLGNGYVSVDKIHLLKYFSKEQIQSLILCGLITVAQGRRFRRDQLFYISGKLIDHSGCSEEKRTHYCRVYYPDFKE